MQQISLAEEKGHSRSLKSACAILLIATVVGMGLSAIWVQSTFASLNSWSSTTKYPIGTWNQSCVVYSGFVYCIGGRPDGGATSPTNAVYFAQLLPGGGLGSWSSTTNNYRTSIDNQSCVVDSGFVYCIGGVVSFSSITSAVYFA